MASLDFDQEKKTFREFYDIEQELLEDAKATFVTIVNTLLTQSDAVDLSKVEGRVKDREEAIRKFSVKYQKPLEAKSEEYEIKDHITDLIGVRAVCLYEDDVENAAKVLSKYFTVIEVTNKISSIESTEDSFGYKGLHMDLQLSKKRNILAEYAPYIGIQFEIQIRTIIQDSWSVLDHKIKYKKSIPNRLKRRINTLSALFELADREFREIRDSTKALESEAVEHKEENPLQNIDGNGPQNSAKQRRLNAFNFLRIASHFFREYEFDSYKVDGFVQDIILLEPKYQKANLHEAIISNMNVVDKYRDSFSKTTGKEKFNPFTSIRHCLYLSEKTKFRNILTNHSRQNMDEWLKERSKKESQREQKLDITNRKK